MSGFDLNDVAYIKAVDESAIVTNGMVMFLDAGNKNSYVGYGTNVKDLSGKGNSGIFTTPIWSNSNGGIFQFNTTNYIRVNTLILTSGTSTIMGAARYNSGSSRARIISAITNNWLLGHWNGNTENFYSTGWVTAVGVGIGDTVWRIYAGTMNTAGASYALYVNGILTAGPNNAGTQGPNGLCIGTSIGFPEPSNGELGFVMAYNRVLSPAEIIQNYRAMKGRYGLN